MSDTTKTKVQEVLDLVEQLKVDIAKATGKGNKAAARRARKKLCELAKLGRQARVELLEIIKTKK